MLHVPIVVLCSIRLVFTSLHISHMTSFWLLSSCAIHDRATCISSLLYPSSRLRVFQPRSLIFQHYLLFHFGLSHHRFFMVRTVEQGFTIATFITTIASSAIFSYHCCTVAALNRLDTSQSGILPLTILLWVTARIPGSRWSLAS